MIGRSGNWLRTLRARSSPLVPGMTTSLNITWKRAASFKFAQCTHRELGHIDVGFHHKHAQSVTVDQARLRLRTDDAGALLCQRKVEREARADTRLASHIHLAFRLLYEAEHLAEPEAGAGAHALGGEERFENAIDDRRIDACTAVGHADGGERALHRRGEADRWHRGDLFNIDHHAALAVDRIACIDRDVDQGGVQLRAVQQYRQRCAGQVRRHRDARTEHGADDVRQSLHALAEIEDFR
ncbi:hypothetical protein G6F31_016073 [Rhizopus arrhizus]|nr:hypothetical protein G6F31_016073 [Rhizopus arrhizus]